MRILILDADSRLSEGFWIAQRLLAEGHVVVSPTAYGTVGRNLAGCGITYIIGHLGDQNVIRELDRADAVIDPSWPTSFVLPDGSETIRRGKGKRRPAILLDALRGSGKPLIVTSTGSVFGDTGPIALNENTKADAPENLRYLARLEKQVLRSSDVSGMVIRLALVHGHLPNPLFPFAAHMESLAKRYHRGTYILPGTNCWSAVHCEDLADLYCLVLRNACAGAVLHAASEAFTMRELAWAIQRGMNRRGEPQGVSAGEARKTIGLGAALLAQNRLLSGEKARAQFGWAPHRESFLEAVEERVRWERTLIGLARRKKRMTHRE